MRILTNKISVKKIRPVITSVEISQVRKVMASIIQSANSEITEEIKRENICSKASTCVNSGSTTGKIENSRDTTITAQLDSKIKCSDGSNCSTETSSSGTTFGSGNSNIHGKGTAISETQCSGSSSSCNSFAGGAFFIFAANGARIDQNAEQDMKCSNNSICGASAGNGVQLTSPKH